MKRRSIFYFFYFLIIAAILYISFLLYFRNIERATDFFFDRKGNVTLILLITLLLSSLFDLISFKRVRIREYNLVEEAFPILGKTFIIILIASFVEFFIFFKTKLGRVIYLNFYFLLSLFLILEQVVIDYLLKKKKEKILWLSSIPFAQVQKDYLLHLEQKEVHNYTDTKNGYDLAIYDYPPREHVNIKDLLNLVISIKNPIDLVTYIEENTERIPLKYVDEIWLLKNIRTYENFYDKLKRFVNFFSSLFLLILLFPPSYFFALVHTLTSKGPIFYKQKRLGYLGREISLIKFRTMTADAEKEGPRFAEDDDERITRAGKIMRVFRIDEVPQLINVLKGDMDLIGPRPEREEFIEMLEKEIPFYKMRLEVRPGLTGWAQVNFPYAGAIIDDHLKKLEYDLYYIKNRSLPLDVFIILKTVKTILMRKGT